MAEYQFVEGHTEPINMVLKTVDPDTGVVAAANLTTLGISSVELRLYPRGSSTKKTLTGTYGITTAASGTVYFNPASTDLLHSEAPYKARWWVTDSGGKLAPFPDHEADIWTVRKP